MTSRLSPITTLKSILWSIGLAPTAWLVWAAFTAHLGADPIHTLRDTTGLAALSGLLITLSVTPLRRLSGRNDLIRVRRLCGLFAFYYATVHAVTYFVFDQSMSLDLIAEDVVKHPWVTIGFTAWVLLIPLAVTSTQGMIRRLGGKRWARLHRLIYLVAAFGVFHFLWLVKRDVTTPDYFGGALILLLATRLIPARRHRQSPPDRRAEIAPAPARA